MNLLSRKLSLIIEKYLPTKEFIVIMGARQTGKTSIMKMLGQKLIGQQQLVYNFTLEEPDILRTLDEHPQNLFNYINVEPEQRVYVFIDEIQYLKNPTNFLKYHYDVNADQLKIIATGSSAFYIDRNFKDSLVGRKHLFELYPLDFDEFLLFKNADSELIAEYKAIQEKPTFVGTRRKELQLLLNELLTYGGYPAVVLKNDESEKVALLREIMYTYVKRDVLESGLSQPDKFFVLLKILAAQCGGMVNANELSKSIGVSVTAINNYLYVLQKCFHIYLVRPFFSNIQKELTKMPKVYFNDLGLRNVFLNSFGSISDRLDKGELIENYVFTVLRNQVSIDNVFYWRTADANEVDFVLEGYAPEKKAIEVKFDTRQFKPSKYKKFVHAYPQLPLKCIGYDSFNNTDNILGMK